MMSDTARLIGILALGGVLIGAAGANAAGQQAQQPSSKPPQQAKPATPPPQPTTSTSRPTTPTSSTSARPTTPPGTDGGITPPADYVIGADDQLKIVFWRDDSLSGDVVVRPDGKISLTLLNDIQAAGLTPNQLRESLVAAAARYVTDPSVTVIVKAINSRKVYVTGQVNKPGPYLLNDNMTVLQMLAVAGGLQEWADADHILIMRTEGGQTKSFKFNYKDVSKGKSLQQNIMLKPGDTIVVP
jgi:polysaccharide biosynthesis/export protein